jgi:putative nucleotidyltransferase with HDIG domain
VNRELALEALKLRLEKRENIAHSLAVEAIMRELARYFHEDVDQWGIAGLVHDIDIERVNNDMKIHGMMGGDILEGLDFEETIVYAVRAHNPVNNYPRRRRIDKALYCSAPMSRLILACADGSDGGLSGLDEAVVMEHYSKTGFAPDVKRDQVAACTELGISLEEFAELSLRAMKDAADSLN